MTLFSTLRSRLLALLMAAMLPMAGVSLYLHGENRQQAIHVLDMHMLSAVDALLAEQRHFSERTHQVLRIMANANDTRRLDGAACSGVAARLMGSQTQFANIGAADAAGNIVCSGRPIDGPLSVADREWFRAAVSGKAMTRGYYQVSRTAGVPVITFGYPAFDEFGTARGALFASADVRGLAELLTLTPLPPGWLATVIDREGRVLARHPDPERLTGKLIADAALTRLLRSAREPGIAELRGLDGVERRYVFAPLPATGDDVLIAIGGETRLVTAPVDRQIYLQLGLIGLVAAASCAVSWFGMQATVLRWSRRLRVAAQRFGAGDTEARFGGGGGQVAELAEIGEAFDRMADDIRSREIQRRHAETALRKSELKFRAIFEQTYELIGLVDTQGTLIELNETALRFIGKRREDVLGKPFVDTPWWNQDPQQQERLRWAMGKALGGEVVGFEAPHPAADGSLHTLEFSLRPLKDETGSVVAVVPEGRDITEAKRSAEQLRLAARVFEGSREAITITDAAVRILAVNRSFCEITGYEPDEVIGRDPGLLNSGRQDKDFYAQMWRQIRDNGFWQGEIWNRRKDGAIYPAWLSITTVRGSDGVVGHYIGIANDLTEHKQAQERIRHLAHYDALTGLPNRELLKDLAGQALAIADREQKQAAVLCLDVDNFKNINESLGHSQGDILLRDVAWRISSSVRDADTVAHLGGDEFVILLPETGADGAAHAAAKLLASVSRPHRLGDRSVTVTCSVGICVFPQDGRDFETLMQHADTALNRVKQSGRNGYQFFTRDMNDAAMERLVIESNLRRALAADEFVLHFQPQVTLAEGRMIGVEALIRWRDPALGLVPPGKFIPVAEDSGLIVPIGQWVIEEACRQHRRWLDAGLSAIPVAVNLSAKQFRHGDIEQIVATALARNGVAPEHFELELTESMVMEDSEGTLVTLQRLKALGVKLSIDDFGTGYSSLAYLKRFPLDKLKIDQSFVRDITRNPDDLAIAGVVISMGHSLRLKVIAEGVETREQLDILRRQGCDEAQGFHFGRPVPAEEIAALLQSGAAVALP